MIINSIEEVFEHPWREDLLLNLGSVTVGGTPRTSVEKYWKDEIPWMSSGDVNLRRIYDVSGRISKLGLQASNATLVSPPSVAVGLAGQGKTRGTVALVLGNICTNQSVALIKSEEDKLKIAYLFYNLEFRYQELRSRSAGGGRAGLSKGILEQLPIPLPQVEEQKQIVAVLSTIDRAIEQTEAIIAKQQRIKTGLMQDLLTKGIDENGNIRSEETHEFKDSAIGRIPVEWEVKKLEDIVDEPITYGIVQAGANIENGVPYIRTGDMSGDSLKLEGLLRTSFKIANSYQRSSVFVGDIVFALRATVGKVLPVPQELNGSNLTQGTAKISPHNNFVPSYVLWALRASNIAKQILLVQKGTTFSEITLGDLRKILIAVPATKQEQRDIANKLQYSDQVICGFQASLAKYQSQKRGLMQDLLTGKVRVTPLLQTGGISHP